MWLRVYMTRRRCGFVGGERRITSNNNNNKTKNNKELRSNNNGTHYRRETIGFKGCRAGRCWCSGEVAVFGCCRRYRDRPLHKSLVLRRTCAFYDNNIIYRRPRMCTYYKYSERDYIITRTGRYNVWSTRLYNIIPHEDDHYYSNRRYNNM